MDMQACRLGSLSAGIKNKKNREEVSYENQKIRVAGK